MKTQILVCFVLASAVALAAPTAKNPVISHVPERLDSIRSISPAAASVNHIALVNVANAVPQDAWTLSSTYATSRLQLNVWTNAIAKSIVPAIVDDPTLVAKTLGDKAKIAVFIEDSDAPVRYLSVPGSWCRVNVRYLKSDNPDRQTLLDRYAKAILKGFVYAAGSGAALDGRSASHFNTFDLKGMDKTNITVSPESYFPMLEVLRVLGGEDILTPAVDAAE